MDAQPRNAIPVHLLPDSERLLRTHSSWVASWDASDKEEEGTDYDELVRKAFNLYAQGLLPIQVRWELARKHSSTPARTLNRAQREAEKALCAAESAPPELRRAMVAAARQRAIHGALREGQWGAALKGLDRAGEIAGELRESAGLSEEDLVLTVAIEAESHPLPPVETAETAETGEA
jgi:hypothetical protein